MGVLSVTPPYRAQRSRPQQHPRNALWRAHLAVEGAAGLQQWLEFDVQSAPEQVQLRRQLAVLRGVDQWGVLYLHRASRGGFQGQGGWLPILSGRPPPFAPSATAARPSLASKLNIMLWAAALVTGA